MCVGAGLCPGLESASGSCSSSPFSQRLFGMMNNSAIDVPPDVKTFYLTNVFPLYLLSINTM